MEKKPDALTQGVISFILNPRPITDERAAIFIVRALQAFERRVQTAIFLVGKEE